MANEIAVHTGRKVQTPGIVSRKTETRSRQRVKPAAIPPLLAVRWKAKPHQPRTLPTPPAPRKATSSSTTLTPPPTWRLLPPPPLAERTQRKADVMPATSLKAVMKRFPLPPQEQVSSPRPPQMPPPDSVSVGPPEPPAVQHQLAKRLRTSQTVQPPSAGMVAKMAASTTAAEITHSGIRPPAMSTGGSGFQCGRRP